MASKRTDAGPLEEFTSRPRLHFAVPVRNLEAARQFYVDVLGGSVLTERAESLTLDFFGCLMTAHLVDAPPAVAPVVRHGDLEIPLPSIGLVMGWEDWHRAVDHLDYIGAGYRLAPHVQRLDDGTEDALFVLADPSGNCLTFSSSRKNA